MRAVTGLGQPRSGASPVGRAGEFIACPLIDAGSEADAREMGMTSLQFRETLRPKPDAAVTRRRKAQPTADVRTTTICEAEIFDGVAQLAAGKRRAALEQVAMGIFDEDFAGRVLAFDGAAA